MVVVTAKFAKSDNRGRVRLPKEFVRALPWLKEPDKADAWIFVVDAGRFRILSPAEAERSAFFKKLTQKMADAAELGPGLDALDAEESEMAAMGALLVPVKVSFANQVGWRIQIPTHSYVAASSEGKGFYILLSQGYLELWTQDALDRALQRARIEMAS